MNGGRDVVEEKIKPQMKAIARSVMLTAQDKVTSRQNSCAIYGFDFMIDASYNVWLIEINGSPAMPFDRVKLIFFKVEILSIHFLGEYSALCPQRIRVYDKNYV